MATRIRRGLTSLLAMVVVVVCCRPRTCAAEAGAPLDPVEPRVILQPGRWKIRSLGRRSTYHAYHFFLGSNWTAHHDIEYPDCPSVACWGLPPSERSCDHICGGGTWLEAEKMVSTAVEAQARAARELDATFNDLVALVDTHVGHVSSKGPQTAGIAGYDREMGSIDVMSYHRSLIEASRAEARSTAGDIASRIVADYDGTSQKVNASSFDELMNSWKSGALLLSVQLNSITFALIGARGRLLACTQGLIRFDMTGCVPGLSSEFYTDVPAAGHAPTSSQVLVLEVRRDEWNPVSLSRWFMAFVDTSRENRTCWLRRGMVNDSLSNYREPKCDNRGLCDPLQPDGETVTACNVKADGDMSPDCPIVCGSRCYGPLCYDSASDSYTLRTAVEANRGAATREAILVAGRPRLLSEAHAVSEEDARTSLLDMQNRANRALDYVNRGASILKAVQAVEENLRGHATRIDASSAKCYRGAEECERLMVRGGAAAWASLFFSVLTCPILIILIVKLRC